MVILLNRGLVIFGSIYNLSRTVQLIPRGDITNRIHTCLLLTCTLAICPVSRQAWWYAKLSWHLKAQYQPVYPGLSFLMGKPLCIDLFRNDMMTCRRHDFTLTNYKCVCFDALGLLSDFGAVVVLCIMLHFIVNNYYIPRIMRRSTILEVSALSVLTIPKKKSPLVNS